MAIDMNETATHIAELSAAGATSGVLLSIAAAPLGIPFEAVLLGMLGAIVAESFVPTSVPLDAPRWRRLAVVIVKILAAGLFAGLFTRLVEAQAARVLGVSVDVLHIGVAAGLGIVAPIAVPLIRAFVTRKSGGGQ